MNKKQDGGRWKNPTPKHTISQDARQGSKAWIYEVKAIQMEQGLTYKEALQAASQRRKDTRPYYRTVEERYMDKLKETRDQSKDYKDYHFNGKKNKRPVTMSAAEQILLQHYRDRSSQYQNPLTALKKNISSCHKDPKRTLNACQATPKGVPIVTSECANSWKFRPGKYAKNATGPTYYDIHGLNDLCGPENKEARQKSKLYNMKYMRKKPVEK